MGRQAARRQPGRRGRDIGLDATDRSPGAARRRRLPARHERFAEKKLLEVWYARLDIEDVLEKVGAEVSTEGRAAPQGAGQGAQRDSMQVLKKLTTVVDGQRKIISDPPLVVPIGELPTTDRRPRSSTP